MTDETERKLAWTGVILSALVVVLSCIGTGAAPRGFHMSDFYYILHIDQLEPLLPPLGETSDRTYTIKGIEVEGTAFWWCDDRWVKIEVPCLDAKY